MAHVKLVDITKNYDGNLAVDHLDLEIRDREFVVLLGPSGCGKTTTLRSIAGLEHPDSGDIFIDDVRVNEMSPADRDIAFVFQFFALYPHLTVRQNLEFPLKAVKTPKSVVDERIAEVSKVLHVERFLDRKPGNLSGGEMQRVAIGRAMVRRPKVFLMDEPLTNLDAKLRTEMRSELKRLQNDIGATTVYVTHDQLEAMSMGDKIAIMSKGVLQQIGSPSDVYDRPRNMFVADFIGSPPTNFAPCRLDAAESALVFDEAGPGGRGQTGGAPSLPSRGVTGGKRGSVTQGTGRTPGGAAPAMPLTPKMRDAARSAGKGKALVLGVRPEDIELSRTESPGFLRAEVFITEPLGSENIIDLRLAGHGLKARTAPTFFADIGAPIWVRIDQERMHLFDAETTEAII